MKLFPPPSSPADRVKQFLMELAIVIAALWILYQIFFLGVQFNYTKHAQRETRFFGELVHTAITNYAADFDETFPPLWSNPEDLSHLITPYQDQRSGLDKASCPEVEISFNVAVAGKSVPALSPKTELFTITNTYIWNNYKVIYHVDGSNSQSELSSK